MVNCGSIVLERDETHSSGREGKGSGNVVLPSSGALSGSVSSARRMLAGGQTNVQIFPKGLGSYSSNVRAAVEKRGCEPQPNLP